MVATGNIAQGRNRRRKLDRGSPHRRQIPRVIGRGDTCQFHSDTMHPCLRLTEIVERICELLADNSRHISLVACSAASLARTCKSLQEPALNFLWAGQQSLTNLLRTFPEDSWQCHSDTYGQFPFVSHALQQTTSSYLDSRYSQDRSSLRIGNEYSSTHAALGA